MAAQSESGAGMSVPEAQAEPDARMFVPDSQAEPGARMFVPEAQTEPGARMFVPEAQTEPDARMSVPEAQTEPDARMSVPEAQTEPDARMSVPAEPDALALLHTSPVHIAVFDALRDEAHQGLRLRHFVAEELLARARDEGPDAVAGEVRAALDRAVAEGARAVLCTCSTLGGVAEKAGAGVPVLRVDRPMAAAAVAAGPRVVVLATVESTLAPTVALVEEEARRAGRPVGVRTVLVDGAWARFEADDSDGYARAVAEAADAVTDADAIVLAQASMAPAEHLTTTSLPVLSSPRPGLAAGAEAVRGR